VCALLENRQAYSNRVVSVRGNYVIHRGEDVLRGVDCRPNSDIARLGFPIAIPFTEADGRPRPIDYEESIEHPGILEMLTVTGRFETQAKFPLDAAGRATGMGKHGLYVGQLAFGTTRGPEFITRKP